MGIKQFPRRPKLIKIIPFASNFQTIMGFKLTPIDVVDHISQEDFRRHYLKPRRPLVIKNMTRH